MMCTVCNANNEIGATYCISCGVKMTTPKKFYRASDDKVVAGVCAGLAVYLNMDVNIVRVLTVLLIVFSGTTALIAYIVIALVVPEKPLHIANQNFGIDAKVKHS